MDLRTGRRFKEGFQVSVVRFQQFVEKLLRSPSILRLGSGQAKLRACTELAEVTNGGYLK